ncbi:MAG: zinc-ribbon domain-containing protein [Methanobrevibacter sp.]|nr:zinc-ribbon domain-containing protein [Methanobrevibacter sp.]
MQIIKNLQLHLEDVETSENICENCGSEISYDDAFCSGCGTKII